jgi:hypothetical protein
MKDQEDGEREKKKNNKLKVKKKYLIYIGKYKRIYC